MTIAVVNCSQLATLAGPPRPRRGGEVNELHIIPDGAMIVRNGRIDRTGSRREIEPAIPKEATIVDAGGRLVMPGFVDAHTHPVFAGNRAGEFEKRAAGVTYQEIAAAGGGILSTVRKTREASAQDLETAASRHAAWFLRCGTTTIEAKSGYGLTPLDEFRLLSIIGRLKSPRTVPTFLGAHEIPPEYRGRPDEYVDIVAGEMIPEVASGNLAAFCDVFCEQRVFSVEQSRRVLAAAKAHGLGLRIHADQLSDSGAAKLAAELGAATADHLEHTNDAGIAALARAGVQPVLLPASVYALGSTKYPAARAMIDAGLGIVLATDFNPGSSPTPSMPMVLSLAVTHMKMSPAEAITAATINAAYSLNLGAEIGSLEPGKRADFVIHDCADYRELAYYFGIESAAAVYMDGVPVFRR